MLSKEIARRKRHARVRKIVSGTETRPRVAVYKSNLKTYVQVINDCTGHIILGFDTDMIVDKKNKKPLDLCNELGKFVGEKLQEKNIAEIVFDRSGYKYHGKVKALATGMREVGIKF